ncbi:hypothetical protein C8R46DRAFT_1358663 [Mycena filopes]|nr:hypothetical protein C8R46DRAFT_1358663 [Mycena filopes]
MLKAALVLLGLANFCEAAQMRHFIDDFSVLAVYQDANLDRSLEGFAPSEVKDGTITLVTPSGTVPATINMNFTGTEIEVYVAYPSGRPALVPSAFSTVIDGVPAGGWARGNSSDPLNGFLAYHNTTLVNRTHSIAVEIQPGSELYFDFAVYTSFVPDPSSSPSLAPPENTSGPTASSPKDRKSVPVGAIIGGVLGGLCLLALILTPLLLRRRARARMRATSNQPILTPYLIDPPNEKHGAVTITGKGSSSPPPTPLPFVLQSPRPRVSKYTNAVSDLEPGSPTSDVEDAQSPLSPTGHPSLLLVAGEVRRLAASLQRLETGIPEARDGGPVVLQRPPAYGSREGEFN